MADRDDGCGFPAAGFALAAIGCPFAPRGTSAILAAIEGRAELRLGQESIPLNGHPRDGRPRMREFFRQFSARSADIVGSPWAFLLGVVAILLWAAAGPTFHYSDTWQLIVNSGSSIVTFLMVFLIQNTQNRDARAMQMKLNELIRAVASARNFVMDLENCSEEEIAELRKEFEEIRARVKKRTPL